MQSQVVDHAGISVGILVPSGNRLRFMAVKFQVFELDGRIFGSVNDAKFAISSHLKQSFL